MVGIYISYTQEIAQTNIYAFLLPLRRYNFFLKSARNQHIFLCGSVATWMYLFVLLSQCGRAAFQFLAFKLSGVPDNAHALWGALKL